MSVRVLPRTFASFRSYNYRLFWFGQLISQMGTWMQRIGQSWLVLQLAGTPDALGLVTALQFAPILLLSLFAGVWVDRLPKHRVLIGTQSAALVQAAILAGLTIHGGIQLWEVYALAALLGTITAFDNPTRQAFLVEMVGRENLVNAVGLNSAQFNGARLLGPALGGLIIAAWGVGVCFLLNAISFLAVLIGLVLMRPDMFFAAENRLGGGQSLRTQLLEGLRFIFRRRDLAIVMGVVGVVACFGYNFTIIMPLMAQNAFHAGAGAFGLLMAAIGLGSLLAALAVATLGRSTIKMFLIAATAFSVLELASAFFPWLVGEYAVLVGLGYAGMIFTSSANTQLQLSAPDYLRGRVMSVYTLIFVGSTPIGSLATGYLADVIHVRLTLGSEAALCLVSALVGVAVWNREPRRAKSARAPVLYRGAPDRTP